MISEAYVAGLFDGEGSVGRYPYTASKNGRVYYRLHARISNNNRALLAMIQAEYGGGIYPKNGKARRVNTNPNFDLHFTYRKAEAFLKSILPFLILKKQAVEDCLSKQYPPPI